MKILIIDDNLEIIKALEDLLQRQGFETDQASTGLTALGLLDCNTYNLILLDLSLPDIGGDKICRKIRAKHNMTPILVMSADGDIDTKVHLLNLGADDYLVKPVAPEELLARVQALLRRPPEISDNIIKFGNLELNQENQIFTLNNQEIYLTKREFLILEYLIRQAQAVVSHGELMDKLWNNKGNLFSKTIEMHIVNLRKKMSAKHCSPKIKTIPGRGYKLDL